MKNNNRKAHSAGTNTPNRLVDRLGTPSTGRAFSEEALAHCLADLKRQLELRQAMH